MGYHVMRSSRYSSQTRSALSVATLVCNWENPQLLNEVEAFRVNWEQENNQTTDLTRFYSSMRPVGEQTWMLANATSEYFAALPPFLQEFIHRKIAQAASNGNLDSMPHDFIRLFITGRMQPPSR